MKLEILSLFQIVTAVLISQAAAVCFNMPDDTFVADPNNRRGFFWCYGGSAYPGDCDEGEIFENGFCEESRDPCANKPDEFFAADSSNPRAFYWCSNGVGHHGECPDGEYFFEHEQACGYDETTLRLTAPPRTTRPMPPPIPTRPPPTTRAPSNPCSNRPDDTFVANPDSRRGFFWCYGGSAYPGECDEGEIFMEEEQYCDVEETTTRRPVAPTRPTIKTTTRRPVVPTRPTSTTRRTTRPSGPVAPTRGTTRGGAPPIPIRTTTRRPIVTRPPRK